MALPNFIIAGAPKCGTTALWALLQQHPEICLSSHKEPRFFSRVVGDLERGVMTDGHNRSGRFDMGFAWYEELFTRCQYAKAIGEASTHYFSAEDSAGLIAGHVPDVRLIFMLRDPVERAYSHYWQESKLGWRLPSFEDMVRGGHPRLAFYLRVSHYRMHLERFRRHFAPERLLVLLNEDMIEDPHTCLGKVCEFLGVDQCFDPDGSRTRFNPPTEPRIRAVARLSERLRYHMAGWIPTWSRRSLGRFKRTLDALNGKEHRYDPLSETVRRELLDDFGDDVDYVERVTTRDLSAWRAVRLHNRQGWPLALA